MVNDFEKQLRNELEHIWEEILEINEKQKTLVSNQNRTLSGIDAELNSIKCIVKDLYDKQLTERISEETSRMVDLLHLILEQQKETNTLLKDLCDKKE